jgi:hypothetical protein
LNSHAELRPQPWTDQKRPRALKLTPPGIQPRLTEESAEPELSPL